MRSNDQRLFDQKAVDVVVSPQNTKILPVHVMARTFFVFGDRGGVVDVLRLFVRLEGDSVDRRLRWSPA